MARYKLVFVSVLVLAVLAVASSKEQILSSAENEILPTGKRSLLQQGECKNALQQKKQRSASTLSAQNSNYK